ncbi:hypothetical protein TorRG33x02_322440 [Trema orientale]|uniref:Uncharacterized protein n=1 Tax=Trema orientale TaxID=63057 RepID=A0A2P5BG01_TREOI|nr:hypothetical protein TorRG33x02_322440 [Trema orientale]
MGVGLDVQAGVNKLLLQQGDSRGEFLCMGMGFDLQDEVVNNLLLGQCGNIGEFSDSSGSIGFLVMGIGFNPQTGENHLLLRQGSRGGGGFSGISIGFDPRLCKRGSAPAIARVRPLRIGGGHGLGASTAPPPHTLVQSRDHHVGPVIASILSPVYFILIHAEDGSARVLGSDSDLTGVISDLVAMANNPGQGSDGTGFTGMGMGFDPQARVNNMLLSSGKGFMGIGIGFDPQGRVNNILLRQGNDGGEFAGMGIGSNPQARSLNNLLRQGGGKWEFPGIVMGFDSQYGVNNLLLGDKIAVAVGPNCACDSIMECTLGRIATYVKCVFGWVAKSVVELNHQCHGVVICAGHIHLRVLAHSNFWVCCSVWLCSYHSESDGSQN